MLFGAHVSIQGGFHKAPAQAEELGCECFQIFSRSPRGGPSRALTSKTVRAFREACERHGQKAWYIHTPYTINLASKSPRIRPASIRALREELERGSAIGAAAVMTHMGSAGTDAKTDGLERAVRSILQALDGYRGGTRLLVEIAAGGGGVLGGTFEELAEAVRRTKGACGVCFDTQHAFAAGYDLRSARAVRGTLEEFDRVIGLEHLKLSHCNDSLTPLGSRRDRHCHIGQGRIGRRGFRAIVRDPDFQRINFILETRLEGVPDDLALLRRFVKR